MCQSSSFRVDFACTVADLSGGDRYRTPDGDTFLVIRATAPLSVAVQVVSLRDGTVETVRGDIRLGYDRLGRLYAARRLNKTTVAADALTAVA